MSKLKRGLTNLFIDYLPAMLFILFVLLFFATGNIKTTLIVLGSVLGFVIMISLVKNSRSTKGIIKRNLLELFIDWLPFLLFISFAFLWFVTKNPVTSAIIVFTIFLSYIAVIRYKRRQALLNSGMKIIDSMSGRMFKELLLEHFKNIGYRVELTEVTSDYGADLILEKPDERIAVQAKRWKRQVGIKAIQEAVASINYYSCNKAMVISNSYFTKNARELASSNSVELWDRDKLIELLSKARGKEIASVVTDQQKDLCPKCNGSLILRTGKHGKFWGCSNFPRCRHTQLY